MHLVEIPEANIKFYIPSNLGECTPEQYINMCALIFQYHIGAIDYDTLRVHAVYKLCNIKESKKPLPEFEDLCKWSNIYKLSLFIDEFFEDDAEGKKVIIQNYIHNPVPEISILKKYCGPSDQFMNITFGEYSDVLRLFNDFNATGNKQLLYIIAAILYRPKKAFHCIRKRLNSYDGDPRVSYNTKIIEARADKFKVLDIGFIYGVYLFFASFQKFIVSANIMWGGREIDFSILFETQEDDEQQDQDETIPGLGMDSIIFTIAESGAFGTTDQVRKVNFWEVFIKMYDLRKRDLDQKKQLKNDKPAET